MRISIPYYKGVMEADLDAGRVLGAVKARHQEQRTEEQQRQIVAEALREPIESPRLRELAADKQRVLVITSDHTRPMPSAITLPLLLDEIRAGNPQAEIKIIVATGFHRSMTEAEMRQRFGDALFERETILVHDSRDDAGLTRYGTLPSGGELWLNSLVSWADLLVSEGFIEPHFFAGYSGGRKSVLPGIASRKTVIYNHNAEFIASDRARTGIVDGNPIHIDMLYAARAAHLAFICNVVINSDKEVIYAVSGDVDQAHIAGREFLSSKCKVDSVMSDIVISTNGGYPLDQNIYQAVKGMTAAEATVKEGGVIIMLAKSNDGHGGAEFYKTFKEEKDLNRMMATFLATPKDQTRIDQWQSQIFARLLMRATVIYISDAPDEMVSDLHMVPAHSLEEAMKKAEEIVGNPNASVCAIPDGVSVIVI